MKLSRRSRKKSFLRNQYVLFVVIILVAIVVIVYVLRDLPSAPQRYVDVTLVPPGAAYDDISNELIFLLDFTPSDDNMYLSRIVYVDFFLEQPYHERIYTNGTVIDFILTYSWRPYDGEVTRIDLYFSDVYTNIEVASTRVEVIYHV